jgi:hypothetical protein
MTKRQHPPQLPAPPQKPNPLELYQIIIHCRNETQQRELYERLRREGHRCRLTVL